jgi:hypothetical protein
MCVFADLLNVCSPATLFIYTYTYKNIYLCV